MAFLWLGRKVEEFNAGFTVCPGCQRTRRHTLLVRYWRLEVWGRGLEWSRRYALSCQNCGHVTALDHPPDLEDMAGEAEAELLERPRDEVFLRLAAKMDYLLSPAGVWDRRRLLEQAHPALHGLLLEYAQMRAGEVERELRKYWAAAGRTPPPREPVGHALEAEFFQAATAGYLLRHAAAAAGLLSPASGAARDRLSADDFRRLVAPRAAGRSERGRHGVQPQVAAWIWEAADRAVAGVRDRGCPVPDRFHGPVAAAARACLFYGFAAGVEEDLVARG